MDVVAVYVCMCVGVRVGVKGRLVCVLGGGEYASAVYVCVCVCV